ncbi:GNAT family N-acetyltransferase [Paenibacillus cellulositrophicus]|uniref:GNAT family N-acetyltransferase n=1 Tax=Paenibacillus cellulositrophicus TaxID=562959 RepID=UPI0012674C90|nr:GNAT family N-acetyltransferase [Paenibacillus cellulositrophicus]
MSPITVRTYQEKNIPADQVKQLYDHLGWWPERTLADIESMLGSSIAVGAWDEDRLVGFARAVSDGLFRAYIEDMGVHEDYRKRGLGREIVDRITAELGDIHVVSLFCESGLVDFYQQTGYKPTRQVVMHKSHEAAKVTKGEKNDERA